VRTAGDGQQRLVSPSQHALQHAAADKALSIGSVSSPLPLKTPPPATAAASPAELNSMRLQIQQLQSDLASSQVPILFQKHEPLYKYPHFHLRQAASNSLCRNPANCSSTPKTPTPPWYVAPSLSVFL
jgi:hypothetical protein